MKLQLDKIALLPLFKPWTYNPAKPTLVFHFLVEDAYLAAHLKALVAMKKQAPSYDIIAITPNHFDKLALVFGQVEGLNTLDIARDLYDELSYLHEKYYHKLELFPHCYLLNQSQDLLAKGSLAQPEFVKQLTTFAQTGRIDQT